MIMDNINNYYDERELVLYYKRPLLSDHCARISR